MTAFSLEGMLAPDTSTPGTASGLICVEEKDLEPLFAYLKNGELCGPDSDLAIPLAVRAHKHVMEDGYAFMKLVVEPHPKYKKHQVQLSAEALAASFNGELLYKEEVY